ncbi:cystathionine beta-lyase [Streptococcus equi subsp. zooepidemicus Sz35]|uniref:cystathionine beta-lyase n=1 Tax=Streptococcus equi TaxID=1336 RepID=UPI0005BCACD3|nr:cystathionine beta-lyase [Streptococcus equi]KIS19689.1 cystathionine beta-lyase [Streptococcus equi subsp. zooepidemicus Sz35]MCD3399206.1 cystathionine beta-lyase [Streptococcus equi subsp. zooepidemicus]MCD3402703.1 cystathionine beta-lyase [Streptococcus equi subsp. zooepidemicus]MCD3441850.1 cystathionine beta-lyase [Streptococcus equi subsp. zooepidemicus]MCD3451772.1 cystathionine beta-lyase [Streptococcus equi subsp. zooepidemicus]
MTDYIQLAKTYGGFTSLDTVYLQNCLESLTDQQKLAVITPPPSVINAYFAEIYQKQSPKAATDYYFELSRALKLFTSEPSFDEVKPFVRLNLSGQSYGFAFENDAQEAIVFAEKEQPLEESLLLELAQIFPQYVVYVEDGRIKMKSCQFEQGEPEDITPEHALLTTIYRFSNEMTLLKGFNSDELLALSQAFKGKKYYQFAQREFMIYLVH